MAKRKKDPKGLEVLGLIFLDILEQRSVDLSLAFGEDYTVWKKASEAMRELGFPDHADEILTAARERFPRQN